MGWKIFGFLVYPKMKNCVKERLLSNKIKENFLENYREGVTIS